MTGTTDNAALDPQQIIAELHRKLDEARAELATRNSAYSERIAYQAAANDVLKVMAASPGDPQPVFDLIVERARDLCDGYGATVYQFDGTLIHWRAATGVSDDPSKRQAVQAMYPMRPAREWPAGRAIIDRKVIHIRDLESEPGLTPAMRGLTVKSAVIVPLMRSGLPIGAIALGSRELGGFTDTQVELLQTFADQAVIAIENARLFNEAKDALERQTATAEVLEVINSSPGDLAPVFDAMLERAMRLCQAELGLLTSREDEGYRVLASRSGRSEFVAITQGRLLPVNRDGITGRVALEGRVVHIVDAFADPGYGFEDIKAAGNVRTLLGVPLLRDGAVAGTFNLAHERVQPFTDKQIALVQNFAAQAVIAMENARLFEELCDRQTELARSVDELTATGDVLKIISRSSVDLETVLDTLVETVARLCRADQAVMFRRLDAHYHPVASHGVPGEAKKYLYEHPLSADRGTLSGRVELERRPVHIDDVLEDPEYGYQEGQKIQGYRTMLGIPLLREDALIGIFVINRTHVEPFTKQEIELATTFADQAVIAIENARLFDELRDRQAELRVTFDNMGDGVVMFDAAGRLAAWNRNLQEMIELPEAFLTGRPSRAEYFRYLADRGEFSADLEAQLGRTVDDTGLELRYERMRPDGRVVEVRRNPVPGGGFVLIYSDITQRKRAEEAIRAAKDAAESALRELQTAQASLVHAQKMAALGQVTAGIAHEIKNPLNFVNNFAGLSVELLDELKDAAARSVGALDPGKRDEIVETISMLTGNLEKIVEHGRRADGIVRSMLQHSRGSSEERQPTDLNALAEEALNLAYHGARAQDPKFDIVLEHDLDSNLAPVDVVPQALTRVLLNLIGNGFYAANKRSLESDGTYRPVLKVTTREFGESVEVRVRDNGIGVPPENKDKLFQPFFTTKPTGEGTGLGLSISYEIVTQQHGGTIAVDSEVGDFTEFTVRLPRRPRAAG